MTNLGPRMESAEDARNSTKKALNTGAKAGKAAKKAGKAVKKTQSLVKALQSGSGIRMLLTKPTFLIGAFFSNIGVLILIVCMLLPLSWINMDGVLENTETEGEAYERMINAVLHVYQTAYGGYEDIAQNYLTRYLDEFFPTNGPAKTDELGLDYDLNSTSNLTSGGAYVTSDGEDAIANSVIKKVTSTDYPEEITAEEAIAIQYVSVCAVLDQYYLTDDDLDLNDLNYIYDTFFGGLEQKVAADQLAGMFEGNVEYGSVIDGEWEEASTLDKSKGIINNMILLDTNASWIEEVVEEQSTSGTHIRYVEHPNSNIWSGSLEISIRLKDHENFMKNSQEEVIEIIMDQDGKTEEEAKAQLEEMYSEMADNITAEVIELHNQGIETNPDGSDPTPDDDDISNPLGPSEGGECFPTIPVDTVYIQYGSGGNQYAALYSEMQRLGFSLYGNKIQCVDMAKYCLYLQRGYAGAYGDGGVFAFNLVQTHPDDYHLGNIGELCSGSFVSMWTNGYGGSSSYGHIVYIEAVLENGMVLINEGLPMYTGQPGQVKIKRMAPISALTSQGTLTIAIPND